MHLDVPMCWLVSLTVSLPVLRTCMFGSDLCAWVPMLRWPLCLGVDLCAWVSMLRWSSWPSIECRSCRQRHRSERPCTCPLRSSTLGTSRDSRGAGVACAASGSPLRTCLTWGTSGRRQPLSRTHRLLLWLQLFGHAVQKGLAMFPADWLTVQVCSMSLLVQYCVYANQSVLWHSMGTTAGWPRPHSQYCSD